MTADVSDLGTWAGSTNITTLGTVATGTWNATTIAVNKGGTNLTSYTAGSLLYASAATTIAQVAPNATATTMVLTQTSSGTPAWSSTYLSGYVPYTGATADVALGSHYLSTNLVKLATSTPAVPAVGDLWWDDTSLNFMHSANVTQQIGEEM